MKKISPSEKKNFDFIVVLTVVFTLFFTSFTVSSSMTKDDDEIIDFIYSDSNIKIKEIQRSVSTLNDDVCDDCDDDDDDDDGGGDNIRKKPDAFIFEIKPNPGQEFEHISFIGYGEDKDGEIIAYRWESNIDGLLNEYASFNTTSLSAGLHLILFYVQDDDYQWSDPANITLEVIENKPPLIPNIIGAENGKKNLPIEYNIITTDPNENNILYLINWGDGTDTGWLGDYQSNEGITIEHTWTNSGTYEVKAKAKDVHDAESEWASIQVSMAKYKGINSFLLDFFEDHPNLFPLLRTLLFQ